MMRRQSPRTGLRALVQRIAQTVSTSAMLLLTCCAGDKLLSEFHRPDALEVNEVGLHVNTRYCLLQTFCGTSQFLLVVLGFHAGIATEAANQSSVGSTI